MKLINYIINYNIKIFKETNSSNNHAKPTTISLDLLPNEIKAIIMSKLSDVQDLMPLRLASRHWKALAHDELTRRQLHPFQWAILCCPNAGSLETAYGKKKEKILMIPYKSSCGEESSEGVLKLEVKEGKIIPHDEKIADDPAILSQRGLYMSPARMLPSTEEFNRDYFKRLTNGQPCELKRMDSFKNAPLPHPGSVILRKEVAPNSATPHTPPRKNKEQAKQPPTFGSTKRR